MKHLKKDDGYVLIYVLIVFTILSFVAVSICTMALKNLQAQKADVARMEARYEAEGYLQQFVAELGRSASNGAEMPALESLKQQIESQITPSEDCVTIENIQWDTEDGVEFGEGDNEVSVSVKALQDGDPMVQISVVLNVPITVKAHPQYAEPGNPSSEHISDTYTYVIDGTKLAYESYEISYQTADHGEEGGAG